LACAAPNAKMHTPYGATECLPVATIEAAEVLNETAERTERGAGVCVGRKFDSIDWAVIRISDGPIKSIDETEEVGPGEIGELIVRGPQASPAYLTRVECNSESKVGYSASDSAFRIPQSAILPWHRMGDVGYLDEQGRFWYCGRKSQRVETAEGPIFTECVEAIVNSHPLVRRSALVGIGKMGDQLPIVCVELEHHIKSSEIIEVGKALNSWKHEVSQLSRIYAIECYPSAFPVDVRHNSKIHRELIASVLSYGIVSEQGTFAPDLVKRAKMMREPGEDTPENFSFSY
jgi:acyl-CoA synthetase (AMP-forming)/AMP-acid ligase II